MPAANLSVKLINYNFFNVRNSSSEQKYIEKLHKINFLKIYNIASECYVE